MRLLPQDGTGARSDAFEVLQPVQGLLLLRHRVSDDRWNMGHKQACRSPKSRQVGDLMRICGLKNRADLNGRLVRLLAPGNNNNDGTTAMTANSWQVSLYAEHLPGDDSNKIFLVEAKNLVHIRPTG